MPTFFEHELPPHRTDRPRKRRARRVAGAIGKILLGLLIVAGVCTVIWWPNVKAQLRAFAIVGALLEIPVVQPVVEGLTREPEYEDVELAGMPTRIFHPSGDGEYPAVLFVTGADSAGRKSEDIANLGRGLARAGIVTIVPDLPGLADGVVTEQTLEDLRRAISEATDAPQVKGDRIAVASVSAGAALVLLAAADEDASEQISVVAGIAPFSRVRTVLEVGATGSFINAEGEREEYEDIEWLREAVANSVSEIGGDEAVDALLNPDDPRPFQERYDQLPADIRRQMDELSPLTVAAKLDVPVELVSPTKDRYFPVEDSRLVVEAAPNARLTITDVLDHARPKAGLGNLGDLAKFNGFIVRVLRQADERA